MTQDERDRRDEELADWFRQRRRAERLMAAAELGCCFAGIALVSVVATLILTR